MRVLKLLICFIGIIGCSVEVRDISEMTTWASGVSGGELGSDSSSGILESSGDEEENKFDVGIWDLYSSVGGDHQVSCQNMDFLFVVDNSGSMNDDQDKLTGSVNTFINGLEILKAYEDLYDFHIGVVTTDAYIDNVHGCATMGGLVVQTTEAQCGPYTEGYNFMTKADDISESFDCAAHVGISGSGSEQPLSALINSLEGWLNSPGHCNEGFSRDNAVLAVIIVTDEDDFSGGPIQDIYDHLVWLKGGEEFIIMSGVIPYSIELCNSFWDEELPAPRLEEFITSFSNHYITDICTDSVNYGDFFLDLVNTSIKACDGIIPEG